MAQININVTPQLKKDIEKYMKVRGVKTKSDAIRLALREVVEQLTSQKSTDFQSWLGAGLKAPTRPNAKFRSEDDLWKVG